MTINKPTLREIIEEQMQDIDKGLFPTPAFNTLQDKITQYMTDLLENL
jgi:hypothetical protein